MPRTSSLDDIVLTPRRKIGLSINELAVSYPTSTCKEHFPPLVITGLKNCDYRGKESGKRAAIVKLGTLIAKYKGVNIGSALNKEGTYRVTRLNALQGGLSPLGGMTIRSAVMEIESLLSVNHIFRENGFETVQEPLGIVDFGKRFDPDLQGFVKGLSYLPGGLMKYALAIALPFTLVGATIIWPQYLKQYEQFCNYRQIVENRRFTENLAAAVLSVKGDTRLSDIVASGIKDLEAASEVMNTFGAYIGAQKKLLESVGFTWNLYDTHPGNLVVHGTKKFYATIIDFDGSYWDKTAALSQSQRGINQLLNNWGASVFIKGSMRRVNGIQGLSYKLTNPSFLASVDSFRKGFWNGYRNPTAEFVHKPIQKEELYAAFKL